MTALVLFDMYGVLMQHAQPGAMERLIARTGALQRGIRADQFKRAWAELRGPIDAGRITQDQFWARMQSRLGVALDGPAYDAAEPAEAGTPDPEMVDFALGLRSPSVSVGLLSNIPTYMVRDLYDHLGFLRQMDYLFYSCAMGHAKPDARIYQAAGEQVGVKPADILFLDDVLENVTAARKVGWQAHQHTTIEDTRPVVADFLAARQ